MLETANAMGKTIDRLQAGINKMLKELDNSDDETTNNLIIISDQWEHYLQGFLYEI